MVQILQKSEMVEWFTVGGQTEGMGKLKWGRWEKWAVFRIQYSADSMYGGKIIFIQTIRLYIQGSSP
jgi:hypothetical protein